MKLIELKEMGTNRNGHILALYRCFCGNEKIMLKPNVANGRSKSCGCLARQKTRERFKKHGMTKSTEYASWRAMKNRCYNKKGKNYDRYGDRGISVCDRWLNSFDNFFSDMGKKPSAKHSIDRIDNDGDYSPDNCKWSDSAEQVRNRSVSIMHNGELSSEASRRLGGNDHLVSQRIKLGWKISDAFSLPKNSRKPK